MPERLSEHEPGYLHQPSSSPEAGVLLTHGAGGNARAPLLCALAESLCTHGFTVLRYDLPFRQQRPFGPPSPHSAEADRKGLREAAAHLRRSGIYRVYLGGHSYGGRQASILAAEEPEITNGLLLLSYPLHPPNKPETPRTAHFPNLRTPALFVHGSKDPFATEQELHAALKLIPARTEVLTFANVGHDLKARNADVAETVTSAFLRFLS